MPLSFFGGIGAASASGILVKGGNYLEVAADLDTIVFDKTGTLTKGEFEVNELLTADGVSEAELLEAAAYAENFQTIRLLLPLSVHLQRKEMKLPQNVFLM